jgi:hypothetical protein
VRHPQFIVYVELVEYDVEGSVVKRSTSSCMVAEGNVPQQEEVATCASIAVQISESIKEHLSEK